MGVSVGMVVLDARQHTVSSALRSADMACYAAKRKGRNRVEVLEAA
ncbi:MULTISPECIES: diguanylate cyclase domain-containing protein, partial [Bacteria]